MDILDKILHLLSKRGLSDLEFTERVGIYSSAVTEWKKKKTTSYKKHLPKIAEVLGVTVDELMENTDDPTPPNAEAFYISPEEQALIEKIRKLDKAKRDAIETLLE